MFHTLCNRTTKRILIFISCLLTGLITVDTAGADRPNVLFILADDLGYGDLRCYGNPYLDTPVIDSLAESGIRLTHHYSPSPLCAPARAGYLTGRYNHRTGAVDVSSNRGIDRIALSEVTFGDYFRKAGYTTALIGKWHNGIYCHDYLPHQRGFDLFYGFANGGQDYWKWNLQRNDAIEPHDGRYLTDVFNHEAIEFIRSSHKQQKPFALFLAHHPPHPPLQAPDALVDKYKNRLGGKFTDDVATIYAMIEQMDTGLGWLMDELRRLGIMENTLIVFTSDNGAHLGGANRRYDAGLRGNKGNVLEQGIRVPAIAAWSGMIPGGRVDDTPVHGCDWLPTLFNLAGVPAPDGTNRLDGVDIFPLLAGQDMPALASRRLPFQKNRYTPVAHSDAAIRQGPWKLYWPGEKTTMKKDIGRDNPSYERGMMSPPWEMPIDPDLPGYRDVMTAEPKLYDLGSDPGEEHDLAAAYPKRVQELADAYDEWFTEVAAEWTKSNQEIRRHDQRYWESREIPDPAVLFRDFWQWHRSPGTDPTRDNPLEVFTGYWNYKEQLE